MIDYNRVKTELEFIEYIFIDLDKIDSDYRDIVDVSMKKDGYRYVQYNINQAFKQPTI